VRQVLIPSAHVGEVFRVRADRATTLGASGNQNSVVPAVPLVRTMDPVAVPFLT